MLNEFVNYFKDLHFNSRSSVLIIPVVMSFWYIDIYMFGRWFYEEAPIHVPIIMSFCLTIGLLAPIYLAWTLITLNEPKLPKKNDSGLFLAFMSIAIMVIVSAVAYLTNGKFRDTCIAAFSYAGGIFFVGVINIFTELFKKLMKKIRAN